MYGQYSDRQVALAWMRGRLRIVADSAAPPEAHDLPDDVPPSPNQPLAAEPSRDSEDSDVGSANADTGGTYSELSLWEWIARTIETDDVPPEPVVDAICDTLGFGALEDLHTQ